MLITNKPTLKPKVEVDGLDKFNYLLFMYRKTEGGCNDKGAVAAEMSIRDISPEDGRYPDGSHPFGEIVG